MVTLELERERELHSLFAQSDPKRLLDELAVVKGRGVLEGKSLLFLDEIQACPKALAMLRYFHELLPELHVIAAGSLLDFALREFEYSMPLGRIEFVHLQPMSFEEFVTQRGNWTGSWERCLDLPIVMFEADALEQNLFEDYSRTLKSSRIIFSRHWNGTL